MTVMTLTGSIKYFERSLKIRNSSELKETSEDTLIWATAQKEKYVHIGIGYLALDKLFDCIKY